MGNKLLAATISVALAGTMLLMQPIPSSAQSEVYAFCKGRNTNYWYIVPRSMVNAARGNLGSCNFHLQTNYAPLSRAISEACFKMQGNARNWPQTRSSPPEFGISISC